MGITRLSPIRLLLGGIVLVVSLIMVGISLMLLLYELPPTKPSPPPPTLGQVRDLSELVTLEVPVTDVLTYSRRGYLGSLDLVLIVHGRLEVGTDLGQARFDRVDEHRRHATLVLPRPTLLGTRLDHDHTRVARLDRRGAWPVLPASAGEAELVEYALAQAQRHLREQHLEQAHLLRAEGQAEQVLRELFEGLGWTLVIRWE